MEKETSTNGYNYDVSDLGFRPSLLLQGNSARSKDFWELCNSYSWDKYARMLGEQPTVEIEEEKRNTTPVDTQKDDNSEQTIVTNLQQENKEKGSESKAICTKVRDLRLAFMKDIKLSKTDRIKYRKALGDEVGLRSKSTGQKDGTTEVPGKLENCVDAQRTERRKKLVFLQQNSKSTCKSEGNSATMPSQQEDRTHEKSNPCLKKTTTEKIKVKEGTRKWKSADARKRVARCQARDEVQRSCPATSQALRHQAAPLSKFSMGIDGTKQSLQGILVCKSVCSELENRSALVSKIIEELFPLQSDTSDKIDDRLQKNSDLKDFRLESTFKNISKEFETSSAPNEENFNRKVTQAQLPSQNFNVEKYKKIEDKPSEARAQEQPSAEHQSRESEENFNRKAAQGQFVSQKFNAHDETYKFEDKTSEAHAQKQASADHQSNIENQTQTDKTLHVRLPNSSENTNKKTIKLRLTSRERRRSPTFNNIRNKESMAEEATEKSKSPNDPFLSLVCLKKLFPNANLKLW